MPLQPESWRSPVPIAHRGSRLHWPENTMEAFAGAVGLGFRHIETDLHITADGVLVCLHDPTLERTTDGSGPVAGLTFEQMSRLDAGYRHVDAAGFSYRGRGIRVPAFEELVTSFPDLGLVVDLKADGMAAELARLVSAHKLHERLIAGSFKDQRLRQLREASGESIALSTGTAETRRWMLAARLGRRVQGDASVLQVPLQRWGMRVVDERLVNLAHESGLHVQVWTVNDRDDMNRLLDIGVDGLVTDRPDLLKEVLLERGEWSV